MRCLTLADVLCARGAECVFLCRPHAGHLLDLIVAQGHEAIALPPPYADVVAAEDPPHANWLGAGWEKDAQHSLQALAHHTVGRPVDWLVVDHYALDARWERMLRPACQHLMVIDDLADRAHDCDLLLDQSLGRTAEDYAGLLPETATTLLGPQYALLRPEFARLRAESLARRAAPRLERVLVTMGGVDKDNATALVLDALDSSVLPDNVRITVVMGGQAPWLTEARTRARRMRLATEVLVDVRDMARLMAENDLAIGAGGTTTWERCSLGLPTFTVVVAENQREVATAMAALGAMVLILLGEGLGEALARALREATPDKLANFSRISKDVCDGAGGTRVLNEMAHT